MTTADQDAVRVSLRAAFGERVSCFEQVGETKTMGFSGAEIRVVQAVLGVEKKILVLKRMRKQKALLSADADTKKQQHAQRTDFSYGNEAAFLATHAESLNRLGCCVPHPLRVQEAETSFEVLMEGFTEDNGWQQHSTIPSGGATRACLRWLARLHAAFLPAGRGGGGLPLLHPKMWTHGTHLALEKRPPDELQALPAVLATFLGNFAAESSYFSTEGVRRLPPRLLKVAEAVAWRLRPTVEGGGYGGAAKESVTMVHGDYKQANMFFRDGGDEVGSCDVAVIDWQWTGPGVGATDLLYLCVMALPVEAVVDVEAGVIAPYHQELCAALGGGPDRYPLRQIQQEFRYATLDFMRWMAGARLQGFTPAKMAQLGAAPDAINRSLVLRTIERMEWLWRRCEEYIDEVEESCLPPPRA
jgi:hypothetical protein